MVGTLIEKEVNEQKTIPKCIYKQSFKKINIEYTQKINQMIYSNFNSN